MVIFIYYVCNIFKNDVLLKECILEEISDLNYFNKNNYTYLRYCLEFLFRFNRVLWGLILYGFFFFL